MFLILGVGSFEARHYSDDKVFKGNKKYQKKTQFFSVDKKLIDYQDKIIPEGPTALFPKKSLKVNIYKDN